MKKAEGNAFWKHPRGWLRVIAATLIGLYLLAALFIIALRFVVLPHVNDYRDEISAYLSKTLKANVRIGEISPAWDTYWPKLTLKNVEISSDASPRALRVPEAEGDLDWSSIPRLTPIFVNLSIKSPDLTVTRLSGAKFDIGGITVDFGTESDSGGFISWLLAQKQIHLSGSRILYRDASNTEFPTIELQDGRISYIKSLKSWNTGLQGNLAVGGQTAEPLDIRFSIRRHPFRRADDWKKWDGRIYASFSQKDLMPVVRALPEKLPVREAGAHGTLWADYANASISRLLGTLDLDNLKPASASDRAFSVSASALFDGKLDKKQNLASITIPQLSIQSSGNPARTLKADARISLSDDHTHDTVNAVGDSLGLKETAAALEGFAPKSDAASLMRQMTPTGQLENFRFALLGSPKGTPVWDFTSDFRDVSFRDIPDRDPEIPGMPGVRHLNGSIAANPETGMVKAWGENGEASFPGIFPDPRVPFRKLSGTAFWSVSPKLELNFRDIELHNQDINIKGDADWIDTGGSGTIRVTATAANSLVKSAYKYVPTLAGAGIIDWLHQALLGGVARNAAVEWYGPIDRFPYNGRDAKSGLFLVTGNFRNSSLDFLPSDKRTETGARVIGGDWPIVSRVNGQFLFEADRMVIAGDTGISDQVPLHGVIAEIPHMGGHAPDSNLFISGRAAGSSQQMLHYLTQSPVSGWLDHFLDPARATGTGSLSLALSIPLSAPERTLVAGTVRLDNNRVDLGNSIPEFDNASGTIRFTQGNFWSDGLNASVWGIPAQGTLRMADDDSILVDAKTRAGIADLKRLFGSDGSLDPLLAHFSGSSDAQVHVRVADGSNLAFTVNSDMKGIAVDFPHPFKKSADETLPAVFTWDTNKDGTVSLTAKAGSVLNALATMKPLKTEGYEPLNAAVGVGEAAKLPKKGLSVRVTTDRINVNHWQQELEPITNSPAVAKSQLPLPITEIRAKTKNLVIGHRSFPDVSLAIEPEGDWWLASLHSASASGNVRYRAASGRRPAEIRGELSHLYIPEEGGTRFRRYIATTPAEQLPSMDLRIRDLQLEDMKLGSIAIMASSAATSDGGHVWTLKNLSADNGAAKLTASGSWTKNSKENLTKVSAELISRDTGRLLKELSAPSGVISGAPGEVYLNLSWKGAPQDFNAANLNGDLVSHIRSGRFLQVDPGLAGRFLSLLSMQSLLKRLTLDFRDVFGKGFSFDTIDMTGQIHSGVLTSKNMSISGSAASIVAEGSVSLPRQRVNAKVLVLPDIHIEGPALALTLANPIAGIGGFIASFGLKVPLSHILSSEYVVEGPFDNLSVTKANSGTQKKSGEK
ncbi:putative exported protein [Sutterella sp. CAG:351]|uniref:YhdP family protein n=1 Tax=Dakarella massiliensis TaxID=1506471 RepID=UPI00033CDF99|nr:YhdP family protein [Dakarella massiliensis]CDE46342.1 putative exported protein [Sutterella sp. CAG:351]